MTHAKIEVRNENRQAARPAESLNVVLATSAKDEELDLMLDALGARDAVGTVVSSGDVKQARPDPEIVHKALEESGTDPRRAVMVGDTVWDVLAARRAGVPCIGLLSGGIGEEDLRGAGAAETYRWSRRVAGRSWAAARSAGSAIAPVPGRAGPGRARRR